MNIKRISAMLCTIAVLLSCTACGVSKNGSTDLYDTEPETQLTEEDNMFRLEIKVGDQTFSATLYDNEAAKALIARLPMTLDMSELNGNEKYCYLDGSLPTYSAVPPGIETGDIMLYGNSCLVLFYKSFSTSYSYTPLGRIDDADRLDAVLGDGGVQITFSLG